MSSKTTDFGTSGRRGEVVHLTQLEVYLNALAELEYLQSLPPGEGSIVRGDEFFYAFDLRPSSSRFVPEQQGRGGLAQAVERAIFDAGMKPVNLGPIPTPALTFFALQHGKGSMMITGSHIPFERNVVAEYLGVDAVVVPISCNDAIDRGALQEIVEPKTRIGSPFVIAGMDKARVKGRKIICGWEANGGFLTGSDIERSGKVWKALPTRDAILPISTTGATARSQPFSAASSSEGVKPPLSV